MRSLAPLAPVIFSSFPLPARRDAGTRSHGRVPYSLLTVAWLALAVPVLAQAPSAARPPDPATGEIRGRLHDSVSARSPSAGAVTIRRQLDSSFAGGALIAPDGSFRVDGLPAGRYTLRVRSPGWAPLVRSDIVVGAGRSIVDLGTLPLAAVTTTLATQEVTSERDEVSLAPDRNSYAVKNMTTASGGTAVDVLRNIPSVEVDASNKVSLRGNANVVIQINGRSSPLKGEQLGNFLAQLPSSVVANVEVATNPSAKNDPEGTAGIINIVLNQQTSPSLSGGWSASTGTTGLVNVSGNLGKQASAWTLFASGSFFRDVRSLNGNSDRTLLALASPASTALVTSAESAGQRPVGGNFIFRSEYRVSANDAFSADALVSRGSVSRETVANFTDLTAARAIVAESDQFSTMGTRSLTQDYVVGFRHTPAKVAAAAAPQGTTLSAEVRFARSGSHTDNALRGVFRQSAWVDSLSPVVDDPTSTSWRERDITTAATPTWIMQSDLTRPVGAGKLEGGIKATMRNTSNDFASTVSDPLTGVNIPGPGSSAFDYRERVGALYGVYSVPVGRFETQVGLRLEQASTTMDVQGALLPRDVHYASAFPSGVVSYNVSPTRTMKASYARRITRPDPFQLSPVVFHTDTRAEFHGNPELRPEYTDSYELGFQDAHSWGSVQLTPYVRRTAHAVRFIQTIDASGFITQTFANVASALAEGADLNTTVRRGALTLNAGGGAFHYASDAGDLPNGLSARAFNWSARTNASWKFSALTDAQVALNYRAPAEIEGGRQLAFFNTTFAVRYKLWGDKGGVSLRIADPFNMTVYGVRTANATVMEEDKTRLGLRGIAITFNRTLRQQLKLRPRVDNDPQPSAGPPGPP